MADAMHGISSDVRFNHAAASLLAQRCRTAASTIEGQAGDRAGWVSHGLTDFVGYYAQLFGQNASVQANDATLLASRLREVATAADQLSEEATKEQQRRETARAWKQRQEDRGFWDHVADWFTGGEDPPMGPPAEQLNLSYAQAPTGTRQPLGGSSGSGTSSARPEHLRSFATNSAGANEALAAHPGGLEEAYDSFIQGCGWGSLNAETVWTGFGKYLEANVNDVAWANAVAQAFEAAGGDGVVTASNAAITQSLAASGVNATREDLQIDPPQAYGSPPTTGYANDPVNTATGNFLEPETDLAFTGGSATLGLTRMYNSLNPAVGAFGPGWSSWTETGLRLDAEAAHWVLPDGREVVFPRLADGWDRATTEAYWLTAAPHGWSVTDNTGGTWAFDRSGLLTSHDRGPGTRVTLTHEAGRLTRLAHERGRSITLAWAEDRVAEARASDGRRIAYGYDEVGRLTTATGPQGTRTYRWNAAGLVDRVTDADGVHEATNTYDDLGRVATQVSRHGRLTRFSYLPGRVTLVDNPDGSHANTWIHDRQGRLVGVIDAEDRRQSMAYDRHGNTVMVTERDGTVVLAEFDERGRRTTRIIPAGGRIDTRYDDSDRVVEVALEGGGGVATTRYAYDGTSRNPHTLVDAEGGTTRFTWDANLLTSVTDPTGVRVTYAYDAFGDLIATTDAEGRTARLERDAAGRVTAAITPGGHRTTFVWDDRGTLTSRTDPDGGTWRFEHTAAGRVTATIDPYGARTEVAHDAAGEAASTTDPLGRTLHRAFDELGNLSGVTLPDGSRWEYAHDQLSRLVAATDPDGHTWQREYDVNGQLAAAIDPTGRAGTATDVASGLVTDTLGRIVSTVAPDGSSRLTRYDRCGRPVEYVDPFGSVTALVRDAAGRVTELRRPDGATTRYAYDACGRLSAITDPLGATTSFGYSLDGHLATQTDPTGAVTSLAYDASGRLVARVAPGVGRTTWSYDLAGRLVRTRDPLWGTRSFAWDAAGQMVSATNPVGGVTRYTYDDLGRMVTIADPLGNVTTRAYNGRHKVVRSVDPLGRVTEGGYDAAGRPTWQLEPTGDRLEWAYDEAGRLVGLGVDGRAVATFRHDPAARTVVVDDVSEPGRPVQHTVVRDAAGRIVERTRDGRSTRWAYDALGRCTDITTPAGTRTRYAYDAAGRVAEVSADGVGAVRLSRDAAGRVVAAHAGSLSQEWDWADGRVVAHRLAEGSGVIDTVIERDADGRVSAITRAGVTTNYGYDAAGQLVAATGAGSAHTWTWDEAGRLVAEADGESSTTYTYDSAGQLTRSVSLSNGSLSLSKGSLSLSNGSLSLSNGETHFSYDAAGRRTLADGPEGRIEYSWGAFGWLEQVASPARVTNVHVDALGELARVDDAELFWDSAVAQGRPLEVDGDPVLSVAGFTGTPEGWEADGWRSARPTGSDPWGMRGRSLSLSDGSLSLSKGVSVGAGGQVDVAGLEWLGARVYDATTRGFLSVDPLPPVTGMAWAGNPYSYAGNDPLHAVDPSGLRPVTDAELQAYRDANTGALGAAKDWVANNWEYLAGGAMVIAGGLLMATGVGGPAGVALVGMGADTIIQKATTGSVDWGQVAIGGAFSMIPGGGGLVRGVMMAGGEGVVTGGYSYLTSPGPHTPGGLLRATTTDAAMSMVTGGVLPPSANNLPVNRLDDMAPTPSGVTTVYRVESPGNARLDIDGAGNVHVQGDNVLFLNFGDRPRADDFLQQRLDQGFDGTQIRAFDVPDSYADSIRSRAVPESQARGNPVFQVDITKTDSSFGLRSSEFPGLEDAAIPGSGRVISP